jgi:hypothetical protein
MRDIEEINIEIIKIRGRIDVDKIKLDGTEVINDKRVLLERINDQLCKMEALYWVLGSEWLP